MAAGVRKPPREETAVAAQGGAIFAMGISTARTLLAIDDKTLPGGGC